MKLETLLEEIEIQGNFEVVYYDYGRFKRVKVRDIRTAYELPVQYVYCENGVLYIEVDKD